MHDHRIAGWETLNDPAGARASRSIVRDVLLMNKRGVTLFQYSRTAHPWTDDTVRRFLEVLRRVRSTFFEGVREMQLGSARAYVSEGEYVILVVVVEGGELRLDKRAQFAKTVAELERRYGAGLRAVKEKEALPDLERELVQSLGLQ
jgi:hypothetical protein